MTVYRPLLEDDEVLVIYGTSGDAHAEFGSDGIKLYDDSGDLTFHAESETGDLSISGALVTGGTIQTSEPVEGEIRVVISDEVSADTISWMKHESGVDVQVARLEVDFGEDLQVKAITGNLFLTSTDFVHLGGEEVEILASDNNITLTPGTGFGVHVLGTGQLSLGDGTTTDGRLRIYDDELDAEPNLPSDGTWCTIYYHRRTGLANQLKVAFSTGRVVLATAP